MLPRAAQVRPACAFLLSVGLGLPHRSPRCATMAPKKRLRQATFSFSARASGGGCCSVELARPTKSARQNWRSRPHPTMLVMLPPAWVAEAAGKQRHAVCAFDLDGCIIQTKSGAAHPKQPDDWKFLSARVVPKLKDAYAGGAALVVFTNQAGVARGLLDEPFLHARIEAIADAIGVPVAFYAATAKDRFRKPAIGMWDAMVADLGGAECVDYEASFFVGDAAGRPKRPGAKADFSDSDRKFAINAGVRFFTPEMYFDGSTETLDATPLKGYDARSAEIEIGLGDSDAIVRNIVTPSDIAEQLVSHRSGEGASEAPQTLVLMVGEPASGKSTFAERHLVPRGFSVIDSEMQKCPTAAKSAKLVASHLAEGKSVVIAMTNRNKKARALLLEKARAAVPSSLLKVIALVMRTPPDVVDHLNLFREVVTSVGPDGVPARTRIPAVAINTFRSNYAEPDTEEECIDEVGFVDYVPHVESKEHATRFRQFMA
jgi:bifunctional polynucleotide phosphatase/kinase